MTAPKRDPSGKWLPGQSPNPKGRPTTATAELKRQLSKHGEAVVQTVLDAALAGDLTACKLVLDRLSPPLKAVAALVSVSLPDDAGLAGTARAFVDAAASGKIPPDVAGQLVTAVASLARIVEIDELTRRIEALEAAK
ncbi:hypothetical protein ADINL_0041 [Nitrincola lacisaponensis]|uniref:DUF5681 domain-containing protein n=1 Tax=Nitrincola lacisaponensis TaxID=267850 RepID=A0A063Y9G2_9GAMM|nr:DUF5681 domain-containing protein [Nitrincola lacisaponensis]KDE41361.1 hypothetical protein ADINL_0041 [Nitrincola lacisaponensis]